MVATVDGESVLVVGLFFLFPERSGTVSFVALFSSSPASVLRLVVLVLPFRFFFRGRVDLRVIAGSGYIV